MSLLPRGYLDTTVAIEAAQADGEATRHRTIGTGFFIGFDYGDRLASGAATHRLFLATNRHVIAGRDDLLIRVNTKGGAARRVRLPLRAAGWAPHPQDGVDVAVVLLNARVLIEAGTELSYFRPTDTALVSAMTALDIGPGEELFVLGFPLGMSGVERNYVIARSGMIARFDREILTATRTFLIDASVFPGNSGGPVIVKPNSDTLAGRRPIDQAYLIGMVRSYLPYEEVAYSLQSDPPTPRMVFTENSGLAEVIPIDCVKEAADALSERLARAREPEAPSAAASDSIGR
jgi:trypsin-like peptidase